MNFFKKTLKTPSVPTTDAEVKTILNARDTLYIEADEKIVKINAFMIDGLTQKEAFKKVMLK